MVLISVKYMYMYNTKYIDKVRLLFAICHSQRKTKEEYSVQVHTSKLTGTTG